MLVSRALLLTDVVDSTALVERLGVVGAAEIWARHDAVARGAKPLEVRVGGARRGGPPLDRAGRRGPVRWS